MKHINMKIGGILSAILLVFALSGAYAEESTDSSNMNKDQVDGRIGEGKGKIKEVTGKVLGDKKMEVEGNVQKNVGKVQKGMGDMKQDIKEDK